MYNYLKGRVVEILVDGIVLDVSDIGYKILTPNPYEFKEGEVEKLFTYFNVREDAQELYGFKTKEIKALFLQLIKVNGVGPKSALAIIATDDINGLINAIETANVTYLTKFPKLGAKTAGKIILELKGKLSSEVVNNSDNKLTNEPLNEAMMALKALGYNDKEIKIVSKKLMTEKLETNEYIKKALQLINKH